MFPCPRQRQVLRVACPFPLLSGASVVRCLDGCGRHRETGRRRRKTEREDPDRKQPGPRQSQRQVRLPGRPRRSPTTMPFVLCRPLCPPRRRCVSPGRPTPAPTDARLVRAGTGHGRHVPGQRRGDRARSCSSLPSARGPYLDNNVLAATRHYDVRSAIFARPSTTYHTVSIRVHGAS